MTNSRVVRASKAISIASAIVVAGLTVRTAVQ